MLAAIIGLIALGMYLSRTHLSSAQTLRVFIMTAIAFAFMIAATVWYGYQRRPFPQDAQVVGTPDKYSATTLGAQQQSASYSSSNKD